MKDRVDIGVVRYGDVIAELGGDSLKFDIPSGYTAQFEYALRGWRVLCIGRRDRRASARTNDKVLEVVPTALVKPRMRRWLNRLYYEFLFIPRMLSRYSPRVVISVGHSYDHTGAHLYAAARDVKHIVVVNYNLFWRDNPVKRLFQQSIRWVVNDVRRTVVLSNGKFPIEELERAGCRTDGVIEYRPYYPPDYFTEVEVEPLFYDENVFRVLFVGRFDGTKGELDFVDVAGALAGEMPDAVFIMIGDGTTRPAVERKVKGLGLEGRVVLLGMKPSNTIYTYMSRSDVVLVLSHLEGLGKVLIEAKMAGAPTIAYYSGGLKYLIDDGFDGIYAPKGDWRDVAKKLLLLYRDPELRRRLGENARKTREKYTRFEESFGYKLRRCIEGILGGGQDVQGVRLWRF